MLPASLLLQIFGFYGVCTWVLALPETAMGEGGDVAMGSER